MIDWMAFLIVFVTALASAATVVTLFSLGIRFLAMPAPKVRRADGSFEPDGPSRDDEDDDVDDDEEEELASGGGSRMIRRRGGRGGRTGGGRKRRLQVGRREKSLTHT